MHMCCYKWSCRDRLLHSCENDGWCGLFSGLEDNANTTALIDHHLPHPPLEHHQLWLYHYIMSSLAFLEKKGFLLRKETKKDKDTVVKTYLVLRESFLFWFADKEKKEKVCKDCTTFITHRWTYLSCYLVLKIWNSNNYISPIYHFRCNSMELSLNIH